MLKEKWTKRWLVILAGMIAPYFYLVGWQYTNTFYIELGASHVILSSSFHEYIALGVQKTAESFVVGYFWLLKQSLWFYIFVVAGLIIGTAVYMLVESSIKSFRKKDNHNKFRGWFSEKLKNKRFEYSALPLMTSGFVVTGFAVIVYASLVFFTITTFGHQLAKYNVNNTKSAYTSCKETIPNPKHDCTFVYDGSELVLSGIKVGRSSSRISIYNGQTETIELNGHRIVHQFKEG